MTRAYYLVSRGRLFISLWAPSAWSFGYHSKPCCAFCLWLGPLEIMVTPKRKDDLP